MKQVIYLLFVIFAFISCVGDTTTSSSELVTQSLAVCPTPAQLITDLTNANQADVISLSGINPVNCPEVPMTETWAGGKLIFSDSPESTLAKAKLYEDSTLGATSGTTFNRLFVYHVNGKTTSNMRFTVLVKNTSTSSGTLTVQKVGTAGPSTSYLYAGKLGFQRWLTSTAGTGVLVGAGATVRLDTVFDSTNVAPSNLLHGIWDYSMTQSHKITICAIDQNDSPLTVCPGLPMAARDAHQRGTFPFADKIYDTAVGVTVDTADGIQQLPMIGGTVNDTWAIGTDVTDGSSQTLSGNYGILYRMHLTTSATDGQKFGFLFNPRGLIVPKLSRQSVLRPFRSQVPRFESPPITT